MIEGGIVCGVPLFSRLFSGVRVFFLFLAPYRVPLQSSSVRSIPNPRDQIILQYVLRVLYHEVRGATANPVATSAATAAATGTTGRDVSARPTPTDDPAATELLALATAARGFLQRTRVIRKRLNSLCALHPRMMGELLEGRKLRPGRVESAESLSFPDPYELGTLEVRPPLLVVWRSPRGPYRVTVRFREPWIKGTQVAREGLNSEPEYLREYLSIAREYFRS